MGGCRVDGCVRRVYVLFGVKALWAGLRMKNSRPLGTRSPAAGNVVPNGRELCSRRLGIPLITDTAGEDRLEDRSSGQHAIESLLLSMRRLQHRRGHGGAGRDRSRRLLRQCAAGGWKGEERHAVPLLACQGTHSQDSPSGRFESMPAGIPCRTEHCVLQAEVPR